MGFADGYLSRHSWQPQIDTPPSENVRCIAVIPAYREDQLHRTLFSLSDPTPFDGTAEVIVVINVAENSDSSLIQDSLHQVRELSESFGKSGSGQVRFHILPLQILTQPEAGVGLARKIGMDEAVARFNMLGRKDGLIASCDADAIYEADFLKKLTSHFEAFPKSPGCSIYFEHEIDREYPEHVRNAIVQYELYLRYYRIALSLTGHPHAFHTIGSSFVVKADEYCRQGGMNKRKAGEDFYFLQKIIPLGNFSELNTTRILLSPRPSDRVPFGTGAAVSKIINDAEQLWLTYDIGAFRLLQEFFQRIIGSEGNHAEIIRATRNLRNNILWNYLEEVGFESALAEIIANTSDKQAFVKRFFGWFNAFRALKFLNMSHEKEWERKPVNVCAEVLLESSGFSAINIPPDPLDKLLLLRNIERETKISSCLSL